MSGSSFSLRQVWVMTGATPLLVAARAAYLEIMHVLLAAGADPLLMTNDGTTALMAAAGYAYAIGTDTHPERDAIEKELLKGNHSGKSRSVPERPSRRFSATSATICQLR